jgi:hypothetical protein
MARINIEISDDLHAWLAAKAAREFAFKTNNTRGNISAAANEILEKARKRSRTPKKKASK